MVLTLIGVFARTAPARGKRRLRAAVQIDLSRPRDRRIMGGFLAGAVFFLFLSAVGSYNTSNFRSRCNFAARPVTAS